MIEWKTYRLGEIVATNKKSIGRSYPFSMIKYLDTGSITRNHIESLQEYKLSEAPSRAKRLVQEDDIIYSAVRPNQLHYGYISKFPENLVVSTGFIVISCNKDYIEPKFLYYLLAQQAMTDYLHSIADASTSAYPSLKSSDIENLEISLPPLEEQRRIAGILGAIDDKIENNRRINTNLELQAQALYKQWFVDFEFPNEEGKPYKSSGGKMVDSELGPIPEGWKVGLLKDVVSFQSGFAFKSDLFTDSGKYRLITIKGVQDGYLDINGAIYINDIPNKMPSYCLLEEGDIIMSLTGNVGRCCVVDRKDLLLNQRVVKLCPTAIDGNMYIYTMFRQNAMKEKLIALARGTAQANLSPIETANLHTILPDNSIMKKYCEYGEPIFASLLNNIKENNLLAAIRDTLLPKLMSGEIITK